MRYLRFKGYFYIFEMLVCWSVGLVFCKILRAKMRVSMFSLKQGGPGDFYYKRTGNTVLLFFTIFPIVLR
jgi:hypothetical protein